jgi:hypothetical protein
MFFTLVAQEVAYRLRQFSTHVYFLIFFGVSFPHTSTSSSSSASVFC